MLSSLQSSCNQEKLQVEVHWEQHRSQPGKQNSIYLFVLVISFLLTLSLKMTFDYEIFRWSIWFSNYKCDLFDSPITSKRLGMVKPDISWTLVCRDGQIVWHSYDGNGSCQDQRTGELMKSIHSYFLPFCKAYSSVMSLVKLFHNMDVLASLLCEQVTLAPPMNIFPG